VANKVITRLQLVIKNNFFYKIYDALCVDTFKYIFIEEALKYMLRIAAKLTHSMRKCLIVSGDRLAELTG